MTDWLDWPFFEDRHRDLHARVCAWCGDNASEGHDEDVDTACRRLVTSLGSASLLKLCVADGDSQPEVRSLAMVRALLATRAIVQLNPTLVRTDVAAFEESIQSAGESGDPPDSILNTEY